MFCDCCYLLGAAANFGRGVSQSPAPSSGNDLVNDDFDPRAIETPSQASKAPVNEFGDFETAFGSSSNTTHKADDGFADFSSAFSSQPTSDQNLISSTPSTIPHVIPPPNMTPNLLMGAPVQPNLINSSQPNVMNNIHQNLMGTQQVNLMGAAPLNMVGGPGIGTATPVLKSNSDLLGDLASLNIQPQGGYCPPPNNNAGFFGSTNNDLLDGFSSGK